MYLLMWCLFTQVVSDSIRVQVAGFEPESRRPITPVAVPAVETGLVADYLLVTRTPALGCTDCLFVRYYVTKNAIRFVLLDDEPGFNIRKFPIVARQLNGLTDHNGTVLRQDRIRLREFHPRGNPVVSGPLLGGAFSYAARETVYVPELFLSRRNLDWTPVAGSPQLLRAEPTPGRAIELILDDSGHVVSESEATPADVAGHRRTTQYQYETGEAGTLLNKLVAVLPPQRRLVEDKAGVFFEVAMREAEEAAEAEDLKGIRNAGHSLSHIRKVPYFHHPHGRTCTVHFAVQSQHGARLSVPTRISVLRGDSLGDHQLIREGICLQIRVMDPVEAATAMNETWLPQVPVISEVERLTVTHAQSRFQGAEADRDLAEFRRIGIERGYDTNSASLLERLNFAGRNLDIEVWRHDNKAVGEWLRAYFGAVADSPLKQYQPEMAVWLLRRIDASGTQTMYDETVAALTMHFRKTMSSAEIIASADLVSALPFAPFATFCWGVESSSSCAGEELNPARLLATPNPELTPKQRISRVCLAARLLPAFRQVQRSPDKGTSSFLYGDSKASEIRFTESIIKEVALAARTEARSAAQLLDVDSSQRFQVQLAEIESFIRDENTSTGAPRSRGSEGDRP